MKALSWTCRSRCPARRSLNRPTELSVDGGATWTPASTPVRVDLQPNTINPIPTVSQWGLIILALLMLSIGTAFILRQRPVAPAAA